MGGTYDGTIVQFQTQLLFEHRFDTYEIAESKNKSHQFDRI